MNLKFIVILSFLFFKAVISLSQQEDKENFKFKVNDIFEFVSVTTTSHSFPSKIPLEIAVRLKSNGLILDEMIFEYSISSIWRISQTEFFVLLGPENLVKIKIENKKILKLSENVISPFDKPSFGTSLNKNLIFKVEKLLLYYDSFDLTSFKLYLKNGNMLKEMVIGIKYPGIVDPDHFIYPPHRTILLRDKNVYILDEDRLVVYIVDINLNAFREVKLQEGYQYQWDLYNYDLLLLRRDLNGKISKVELSKFLSN